MFDEYVPESVIIVDGSLDIIKRYWLCVYAETGRIYCEKNTSCQDCEIANTIRGIIERKEEQKKEEQH